MNGQKLLFLCGIAMAGFLDFAVGALLAVIVGGIMGISVNIWYLIIGGFLGQSPDLVEMAKARLKGKQALANGHHESWDHWPILMIPLGTAIGFAIGDWYWGIVAFLAILFHYNHDMEIGNSGGIPFFAPFERRYFTWWRGFYDPQTSAMYKPETELEPWIQQNWLHPSLMSFREMAFGSVALGLAVSMTADVIMGYKITIFSFMLAFCWGGTILVWHKADN
ncbi:MAG: metal-dependent hydrolase [Candidatus Kaiserbacteria bacterium]|nr:metal-dependent hydrolase [Candidatus Kaiserbacteria bacterium]